MGFARDSESPIQQSLHSEPRPVYHHVRGEIGRAVCWVVYGKSKFHIVGQIELHDITARSHVGQRITMWQSFSREEPLLYSIRLRQEPYSRPVRKTSAETWNLAVHER